MVPPVPPPAKGRKTLGTRPPAWSARVMDDPADQAEPTVDLHDEDIDGDGAFDATITVTSRHTDATGEHDGDDLEVAVRAVGGISRSKQAHLPARARCGRYLASSAPGIAGA